MSGSSPAGKGQGYVFWKRNGIENAWILAASGGERLEKTPPPMNGIRKYTSFFHDWVQMIKTQSRQGTGKMGKKRTVK